MTSTMQIILGSTSCTEHLRVMRKHGWGRMWCGIKHPIKPYPGERWGFDNGAFVAWRNQTPWDEAGYLRSLEKAKACGSDPYMAVVPDIVAAGEKSLEFSCHWLESGKLPGEWPWYLAVQDGMTVESVSRVLMGFDGLFLGGSDAFKETALVWSDLAHAAGKKFHYGRCGTKRKLWLARFAHADSVDSCLPLWKQERMTQFVRWWMETKVQMLIPWS